MKKIAMTMVALLTMTAAVAQNNENGERREFKKPTPEEMTNRMADQLKLDDKQKTKVLELNKEYEGVLMGGPGMGRGMGRGPRGPRPDGETGATQNNDQQRPQRPEMTEEQRAHISECELDDYCCDWYINNDGTLDDLQEAANQIIKEIG